MKDILPVYKAEERNMVVWVSRKGKVGEGWRNIRNEQEAIDAVSGHRKTSSVLCFPISSPLTGFSLDSFPFFLFCFLLRQSSFFLSTDQILNSFTFTTNGTTLPNNCIFFQKQD